MKSKEVSVITPQSLTTSPHLVQKTLCNLLWKNLDLYKCRRRYKIKRIRECPIYIQSFLGISPDPVRGYWRPGGWGRDLLTGLHIGQLWECCDLDRRGSMWLRENADNTSPKSTYEALCGWDNIAPNRYWMPVPYWPARWVPNKCFCNIPSLQFIYGSIHYTSTRGLTCPIGPTQHWGDFPNYGLLSSINVILSIRLCYHWNFSDCRYQTVTIEVSVRRWSSRSRSAVNPIFLIPRLKQKSSGTKGHLVKFSQDLEHAAFVSCYYREIWKETHVESRNLLFVLKCIDRCYAIFLLQKLNFSRGCPESGAPMDQHLVCEARMD